LLIKLIKNIFPNKWMWSFPIVWVSIEYIRNMDVLTGGPWTALANTQLDFLIIAQNAEITGIYGISFWVILINVLLCNWLIMPFRNNLYSLIILFIVPWITGLLLTPPKILDSTSSLDVAVIQPNIHLSQKWTSGSTSENIKSLLLDSQSAIEKNVDLIIWPETATSDYILQNDDYYIRLIQRKLNDSDLISGIPYYEDHPEERKYYNSAFHITSDTIKNIYHKLKLVPMAEYIPLSNYFPSLKELNLGQANFTRGNEYTIMKIDNIQCATMICFESVLPSLSRAFVNKGADILIYVVNDGWYEYPPEPQQHARQVVYRAIENRKPVIRCANTGISMVVDIAGNIIEKLPLNHKGVIETTVTTNNNATFYTKYGDIFARLNILVLLISLIIGVVKKK